MAELANYIDSEGEHVRIVLNRYRARSDWWSESLRIWGGQRKKAEFFPDFNDKFTITQRKRPIEFYPADFNHSGIEARPEEQEYDYKGIDFPLISALAAQAAREGLPAEEAAQRFENLFETMHEQRDWGNVVDEMTA
jgi:hypothetical protein